MDYRTSTISPSTNLIADALLLINSLNNPPTPQVVVEPYVPLPRFDTPEASKQLSEMKLPPPIVRFPGVFTHCKRPNESGAVLGVVVRDVAAWALRMDQLTYWDAAAWDRLYQATSMIKEAAEKAGTDVYRLDDPLERGTTLTALTGSGLELALTWIKLKAQQTSLPFADLSMLALFLDSDDYAYLARALQARNDPDFLDLLGQDSVNFIDRKKGNYVFIRVMRNDQHRLDWSVVSYDNKKKRQKKRTPEESKRHRRV